MQRVLGVDPGYGLVGFGVIDLVSNSKNNYVSHGSIKTNSNAEFPDRLCEIAADITQILNQYKPNKLVVEKLFFAKNITTAMRVSEAKGVIICECRKYGLEVVELTPLQVKSSLTGNGKAKKIEVKQMVQKMLRLEKLKGVDDAVDALAIAIAGASIASSLKS